MSAIQGACFKRLESHISVDPDSDLATEALNENLMGLARIQTRFLFGKCDSAHVRIEPRELKPAIRTQVDGVGVIIAVVVEEDTSDVAAQQLGRDRFQGELNCETRRKSLGQDKESGVLSNELTGGLAPGAAFGSPQIPLLNPVFVLWGLCPDGCGGGVVEAERRKRGRKRENGERYDQPADAHRKQGDCPRLRMNDPNGGLRILPGSHTPSIEPRAGM